MKKTMLILLLCSFLQGCSSKKEFAESYTNDLDDAGLYNRAMLKLKAKEFEEAIELFTELEIQYPYSPWASRGQLLTGFAHYTSNEYDEAILSLSKFIELNPNHELIPYAIYLKAYSYFERIPDIKLDQKFSSRAFDEFSELVNRYPNSKYSKKSKKHLQKLKNHLAAKEISVGKFYQSNGNFLAAIKRYKIVLRDYRKSVLIPESIYRLIESYISLGLVKQSFYLYKILEFNFPKSKWKTEGNYLVKKYNLNKNLKKYKKEQLDLQKLENIDFDLI